MGSDHSRNMAFLAMENEKLQDTKNTCFDDIEEEYNFSRCELPRDGIYARSASPNLNSFSPNVETIIPMKDTSGAASTDSLPPLELCSTEEMEKEFQEHLDKSRRDGKEESELAIARRTHSNGKVNENVPCLLKQSPQHVDSHPDEYGTVLHESYPFLQGNNSSGRRTCTVCHSFIVESRASVQFEALVCSTCSEHRVEGNTLQEAGSPQGDEDMGNSFDRGDSGREYRLEKGPFAPVDRTCAVCYFYFKTEASLDSHARCHSEEGKIICPFCLSRFTARKMMVSHLQFCCPERHNNKEYINSITRDRATRGTVPKRNSDNGAFPVSAGAIKKRERGFPICPLCNKTYSSKGNLNRHLKQLHERKKPFECEECDLKFSRRYAYEVHLKIVH